MDSTTFRKHMSLSEDGQTVYVLGVPFLHLKLDNDKTYMCYGFKGVQRQVKLDSLRQFELVDKGPNERWLIVRSHDNTLDNRLGGFICLKKTATNPDDPALIGIIPTLAFQSKRIPVTLLTPVKHRTIKL